MVYSSLGIIPAAGKAERFGGLLKELLPIKKDISLLKNTYNTLSIFSDIVVVVSNEDKIREHSKDLGDKVIYLIQKGRNDIWSAIYTAIEKIPTNFYYFSMPDTFLEFRKIPDTNFNFLLGMFKTKTPERFGVLQNNRIINKSSSISVPARAWGFLGWNSEVRNFWLEKDIIDYTDAINLAMSNFGWEECELNFYYDMSNFDDYKKFIEDVYDKRKNIQGYS